MLTTTPSHKLFVLLLLVLGAALAAVAGGAHADETENAIVAENRKAGTTEWLLTKTAVDENHRSSAIEGYASHTSLRAGQQLTVFVSTRPPSKFRCDLYRLGYYQGKGGRHVHSVGPLAGSAQPEPEVGRRNVRECRWSPSFSVSIPDDWLSGVYVGKLTAEPGGEQSYIVFIVRDDRRVDFLFQCSDLTWQAYNRWPAWASLYDYQDKRWETELSNDISFDRPYSRYYNGLPANEAAVAPVVGAGEFLLWEFPLAFWMEKHGYDVTYLSNLDTHNDPDGLLRAKGFLSVGHDEYWTRRMVENVTRARDRGVNLVFLSGNSIWHEIELGPNHAGRSDRTFARARRFEDEAELMGASSYGVGLADWTCLRPDHWLFAGTNMKAGDAIAGLVGWEYHGAPLKDDPSLAVVASGPVKDAGGSTLAEHYAAVVYEGPRGNFVFNAATCWWSMVLSSPPGFINPNRVDFRHDDGRVQQITRNVLERIRASGVGN
jgi:hypothetical protein